MATSFDPGAPGPDAMQFLTDRHLASFTTTNPSGDLQVTPVGVTYDEATAIARVITWTASYKARNIMATPGQQVAICQIDGGRWLTMYGSASATTDPEAVAEGVRRYAERYRQPKVRDDRVVIEVAVERLIGRV